MLTPISALNDNYIWLYARENFPVIVIDLSESEPLLDFLQRQNLAVEAVLLTHNHDDHVQGVAAFRQYYPNVPIYGSVECANWATEIISEGKFNTQHYQIEAISTGGHTAQHLSFVVDNHLFCGDALFSAGCGRVFTGDYAQMFATMQRLNQLPAETVVCPAHEYTLGNLAFVETLGDSVDQTAVKNRKIFAEQQRANNNPTLPSTIELERQINPFLIAPDLASFTALRKAKDVF